MRNLWISVNQSVHFSLHFDPWWEYCARHSWTFIFMRLCLILLYRKNLVEPNRFNCFWGNLNKLNEEQIRVLIRFKQKRVWPYQSRISSCAIFIINIRKTIYRVILSYLCNILLHIANRLRGDYNPPNMVIFFAHFVEQVKLYIP
jgi:hypothetical protein